MMSAKRKRKTFGMLTTSVLVLVGFLAESAVATNRAMMPDFSLTDVNSTSSTYGQPVSPRDHLRKVSAWYFGHAT